MSLDINLQQNASTSLSLAEIYGSFSSLAFPLDQNDVVLSFGTFSPDLSTVFGEGSTLTFTPNADVFTVSPEFTNLDALGNEFSFAICPKQDVEKRCFLPLIASVDNTDVEAQIFISAVPQEVVSSSFDSFVVANDDVTSFEFSGAEVTELSFDFAKTEDASTAWAINFDDSPLFVLNAEISASVGEAALSFNLDAFSAVSGKSFADTVKSFSATNCDFSDNFSFEKCDAFNFTTTKGVILEFFQSLNVSIIPDLDRSTTSAPIITRLFDPVLKNVFLSQIPFFYVGDASLLLPPTASPTQSPTFALDDDEKPGLVYIIVAIAAVVVVLFVGSNCLMSLCTAKSTKPVNAHAVRATKDDEDLPVAVQIEK